MTAVWTRLWTVRYDPGNGTSMMPVSIPDGQTPARPTDPIRDGYEFAGWLADGQPYDFTSPVTSDLTLTGSWTPILPATHTVTFDTGDGTPIPMQHVTDGMLAARPTDPTRKGYVFAGWLSDGQSYDFTGPVTRDLVLTAGWQPVARYEVRFDPDNGDKPIIRTVTPGDTLPRPADPIRDGYRFTGWLLDGQPYDFSQPVTKDLMLTAGWQRTAPATVTIRFDTGDGTPIPSQTLNTGSTPIRPDDPVRDGWRFDGWLLDGHEYAFDQGLDRDATMTAKWVRVHVIRFDTGAGAWTVDVDQGQPVSRPTDPVRDGWRFTGWQFNGHAYDFTMPVTKDMTLTAGWEQDKPATHTVTFDAGNGSTMPAQTVVEGETIARPADPVRKGYAFDGWLSDGYPYDFTRPVTRDIVLTAAWTRVHTVTFDANGGSPADMQEVRDGRTVIRPKDPTRAGWRFTGWLMDGRPYDLGLLGQSAHFIQKIGTPTNE